MKDSPSFRRDWEPRGATRVKQLQGHRGRSPWGHWDLNTGAEGGEGTSGSSAVQALTCGAALNLGFEDCLIYSGKQPRTDSTNTDDLNATLSVPSPHLQILQLCLLAGQRQTPRLLLICALWIKSMHRQNQPVPPTSANTAAIPKHQQQTHPLVSKLPHREGDGMSLRLVPLCHSLFIPGSDFHSAQTYAVQTFSSGSEIPRVSSICSLVNLVCGKVSVNNPMASEKGQEQGDEWEVFTLSWKKLPFFMPWPKPWLGYPIHQGKSFHNWQEESKDDCSLSCKSLRAPVLPGSAQAGLLFTSDTDIAQLHFRWVCHPSTGLSGSRSP